MKNRDYWRRRFEILEASAVNKGGNYLQTLDREYKTAMQNVEAELSKWYQRFAGNNGITLAEAKQWLNKGQLAEFKWSVDDYIKYGQENALNQQWMKQLENASAKVHVSRLEALQVEMQQKIEVLYGNQLDGIDGLARKIYTDGYYHTAFEVQKGFNIGWDLTPLNQKQLDSVVSKPWTLDKETFSDRIWKQKNALVSKVQTEMTQSLLRGDSPDKAIKAISKQFNVSKAQAGRLVMTESAYFASEAQKDCFNGLDVERFEIVATLDSHTSELCQSLDGHVELMKDYEAGVTAPPFHPWCRTTTVPYFEDNFGERAARGADGKTYYVPSNMKYADWKKTFVQDSLKTETEGDMLKVNLESEVYKKLGEEHYNSLHNILQNAPESEKAVWEAYESELKVVSATSQKHPCYSAGSGIEMDVGKDSKGSTWSKPYQTTFHEFGHNIDYLANVKVGNGSAYAPYSYTYKNNIFGDTIRQEVGDKVDAIAKVMKAEFKAHADDFEWLYNKGYIGEWNYDFFKRYGIWVGGEPKFSKSMAYKALEKEVQKLTPFEKADLSDILEGATKNKIEVGFGHGKSYWQRDSALSTEAFAEFYDSAVACPESLEVLKRYLPKSYNIFQEMLANILKG